MARPSPRARYAEVLNQCRDIALIFSNSQLSELFDRAGTAMLDFADRAESNALQGRFFEAMGLIGRWRSDIEQAFRQEISTGFENLGNRVQPRRDRGAKEAQVELSLLDPDEMEESVAAENLVIRANATYFPELYALSQRLTVVNDGNRLKDYEIPAGPHHLVQAFRQAVRVLDVDVKIRVILYALFGKFVMNEASSLYNEINGSLKAAGILPNLKPVHVRSEPTRQGAAPETTQPSDRPEAARPGSEARPESWAAPSLGAELFESILDLMSGRRSGGGSGTGKRRTSVDPDVAAAESRELVSAIGRLQSQTTTATVATLVPSSGEIPSLEVDAAFVERVTATLGQERDQVLAQIDRDKLSPMDSDLIDLIGMLFEYMLNDPVLPNLAKALLSHLHTPYLKVALIDRRLLVDARHPARRLLNQMVEAGSLWVEENAPHRGIFPAMQRVVDRVLQEFTEDIGLFEELLTFFEQAMTEQQRRTDTMEHRTQDAARGREKLQLAKRRAAHRIHSLLADTHLPQAVTAFLGKTWTDQLVFILLRDKDEDRGTAWKQAVATAEDLTALFAPYQGIAERQARIRAVPELRERISDGIRRMGSYTHAAVDALYALLAAPDTWETMRAQAAAPRPVATPAPAPFPEPPFAEADVSEQEQDVIKRLRKMKFGTWFEFNSETGGAGRRIKLSWLSPLTSTCMFVDRSGMQAEIKTLQELARELIDGRAKVIPRPRHPFIERALVSIRKILQSDKEDPNPGAEPG